MNSSKRERGPSRKTSSARSGGAVRLDSDDLTSFTDQNTNIPMAAPNIKSVATETTTMLGIELG